MVKVKLVAVIIGMEALIIKRKKKRGKTNKHNNGDDGDNEEDIG